MFGVSHATAVAVVLFHYFALSLGLYALARRWLGAVGAVAVGLAILASPEAALWGRQVMLDIPSLAFGVWAMVAVCGYLDTKRPSLLYVAVLLVLASAYTKLTGAFLLPPLIFTIVAANGWAVIRDRHVQRAAIIAAVALIPLVFLTVEFGAANLRSVIDVGNLEAPRANVEGWIWYARQFPRLMGWPLLALALVAPTILTIRPKASPSRTDIMLLGSWFAIGYVLFTLIDLKGGRHALLFLPPMLIAAGLSAKALFPRQAAGEACLLAIVAMLGVQTWRDAPVPAVNGYRTAVEWIAANAGKNAIIVFSGERDGSFVFNMRTVETRRDIVTLRSDKLLLSVAVSRELGVVQKSYTEAEIGDLLDRSGVNFVVTQDDFWTDLAAMARLNAVLHSPHFVEVFRTPVTANVPTRDKMLRIYRNMGDVNLHPGKIGIDMPIIGRSISGDP